MAISTYSCAVVIENDSGYIPHKTTNYNLLDRINDLNESEYDFNLIEVNEKQFIRVRPWSENYVLNFIFHLYRFILANSSLPEQIYDKNGFLVDWTKDEMDDPPYQKEWNGAKVIKDLRRDEVIKIIKTRT
jgi:hypothetical protein